MLEIYYVARARPQRLRAGPSAPYLDGFAEKLWNQGYAPTTAREYLRAADHLGVWVSFFALPDGKAGSLIRACRWTSGALPQRS